MTALAYVLIAILIILSFALVLVLVGRRSGKSRLDSLEARVEEFIKLGETMNLGALELSQPFWERAILPILRKLGDLMSRITPMHAVQEASLKLELAGNPARLEARWYILLRFILFLAAGAGGWSLADAIGGPASNTYLIAIACAILAYFMPGFWLQEKIRARQAILRKEFPEMLELLLVSTDAGLGPDAAMARLAEKWDSEFSLVFVRVIGEIQLGKIRRDALLDAAGRVGLPDFTAFVETVMLAETMGVSLNALLRRFYEGMQKKRRIQTHDRTSLSVVVIVVLVVEILAWIAALAVVMGQSVVLPT